MHTLSLQPTRRLKARQDVPSPPNCSVDYHQHHQDRPRSLSYMEKLLGEG
ncbi:MAG: hypothetical protein ACFB0C_10090 [Leptolyngbyaceae cyanobacterium]